MYVGHFAAALALKAKEPAAPTWALLLAVGLLDVLFGPFVLLGLERATMMPDRAPGFLLDHIDWSHSLAMSLFWSVLFGLVFLRRGRRVAVVLGFAVFSHFLMDLPMHRPDLALWPGSGIHLGFGVWRVLPYGWWFCELVVIGSGWAYYAARSRGAASYGGHPFAIGAVLLVLHLATSPWLSPFTR